MGNLTLQRTNARLIRELTSWQTGAIGLLALSVAVNTVLIGGICRQKELRRAEQARYRQQIEQAEYVRDLAVQELGAMSLRWAEEQQARELQAEAYAAVDSYQYIGECTITAYCPCAECCGRWADGVTASGIPAGPGIVAVDPDVIPLGSTVVIDGQRYLAADTGSGVTGYHIDICLASHEETVAHGVRMAEVWVANNG